MIRKLSQLALLAASFCFSRNAVVSAQKADTDTNCPYWAEIGECDKVSGYLQVLLQITEREL